MERQSLVANYTQKKIQEMVRKKYKIMRETGAFSSIEDIYAFEPPSRIDKDNYSFTFDVLKNHIEEKMINQGKLRKILQKEYEKMASIQLKQSKQVIFQNNNELYSEKLYSGLPIFKSIIYMRYQNNDKWEELVGEQQAFVPDQYKLNVTDLKANVPKTKLFLEQPVNQGRDQARLNKIQFQFTDYNQLQIKHQKYPSLYDLQKRADVLAKLLLLSVYTEQHRKLKQAWKNDENYQQMVKNQKKYKGQIEPQKMKEKDQEYVDRVLRSQIQKIIGNLQDKANILAHDLFRQQNGQKAVQTKKSVQKLINSVRAEKNLHDQIKMLVAYKQKKTW